MPNQRVPSRMQYCNASPHSPLLRGAAPIARSCLGQDRAPRRRRDCRHRSSAASPARNIEQILGPGESLDEAANWPDDMRSDPAPFWQKTATPWHYVTLNGIIYDHAPPEGDALEALDQFSKTLQDPNASLADKQLALRFVVHLVGDLHQPLHVGKCCDKGGNDVKVTWFGKPTNLHAVWDSALVDDEQLSFTRARRQARAAHQSTRTSIDWWDINPRDWISESAEIRDTLYPTAADMPKPAKGEKAGRAGTGVPDLSYSYVYRFTPVMERRLSQGGRPARGLSQRHLRRAQPAARKPDRNDPPLSLGHSGAGRLPHRSR